MKIIPLGVNGFVPTFGRQTTSFLALTATDAILLDAGTGVARLFEPQISSLLERYKDFHIVLSHYHLDHVVGLAYLAGKVIDKPIVIHAPAPPIVDADPENALQFIRVVQWESV
jgi:glyoxylase-like metal-dependent hydrolase (beta-lactamase superfamily II)